MQLSFSKTSSITFSTKICRRHLNLILCLILIKTNPALSKEQMNLGNAIQNILSQKLSQNLLQEANRHKVKPLQNILRSVLCVGDRKLAKSRRPTSRQQFRPDADRRSFKFNVPRLISKNIKRPIFFSFSSFKSYLCGWKANQLPQQEMN